MHTCDVHVSHTHTHTTVPIMPGKSGRFGNGGETRPIVRGGGGW